MAVEWLGNTFHLILSGRTRKNLYSYLQILCAVLAATEEQTVIVDTIDVVCVKKKTTWVLLCGYNFFVHISLSNGNFSFE